MDRRKALAVAGTSALTCGAAAIAVAANLGLLAHSQSDTLGKLNARNVADISAAPADPTYRIVVDDGSTSSGGGSPNGDDPGSATAAADLTSPSVRPPRGADAAVQAAELPSESAAPIPSGGNDAADPTPGAIGSSAASPTPPPAVAPPMVPTAGPTITKVPSPATGGHGRDDAKDEVDGADEVDDVDEVDEVHEVDEVPEVEEIEHDD